jgi:hypothetical protein
MRDPERFKIGFCRGLANMGLRPSDVQAAMQKRGGFGANALDALKSLGWASLLVPALVGAGGGGALYAMQSADEPTLEDAQNEELEHMYRNAAKQIQNQVAIRSTRSGGPISNKPKASRGFGSVGDGLGED